MRVALLLGVLSAFFIVSASPAYAFDESSWCSLDARVGDLQRLTCFNGTNVSIFSGGGSSAFWTQSYINIPNSYAAKLVNLSVYVGIYHECAGDLNVDLISPNKTRVRLSKSNWTMVGRFCPTLQFPAEDLFWADARYTPIWINNGTSLPPPWLDNMAPGTNDFNGTLTSFFTDNVNGTWLLNMTDPISGDPGYNVGLVDFWAVSIMMNLSAETTPPIYYDNETEKVDYYDVNALSNFSVKWRDNANAIAEARIENNFTGNLRNETMWCSNIGALNYQCNNSASLPAGSFIFKYYARDSANNWNASDVYNISAGKGNTSYIVNFNTKQPGNPVTYTYGSVSNVTVFKSLAEGLLSIFFGNDTQQQFFSSNALSVSHIAKLPAGNTTFRFVYNQTQNYTHNETTLRFEISKSSSALLVNYTPNTVIYGNPVILQCNATRGDGSAVLTLFNNGVPVSSGPANLSVPSLELEAGSHSSTCRYAETQNFSEGVIPADTLAVQRASPALNLTLNGTESNITISKCSAVNATAWANTGQGQINLYIKNSTHTANPVNGSVNAAYIVSQCEAPGSQLNFTAFYPESQNFSSETKTFFALVEPVKPTYSDNRSDIQTVASQDNFSANFTVTWADNFGVSSAFLENNFSGSFANRTMDASGVAYYFNTSVKTGVYAFRFTANDTSDSWNATDYLAFSVSYSPPAAPPSNPPSGGGGGGGFPSATTTTTTTISTTASTTTTTATTTTIEPNVLITGSRTGDVASETTGNETTPAQQPDASALVTGMVFAVQNPAAVAASLAVLGVVSLNYLIGFDRMADMSSAAKKRLIKLRRVLRLR